MRRPAALSSRGRLLIALAAALMLVLAITVASQRRLDGDGIVDASASTSTTTFRATTSTTAPTTTVLETTTTTPTTVAPVATTPTTPTTKRTTPTTTRSTTRATVAPTPVSSSGPCNTSTGGPAGQLASKFCAYRASAGLPTMHRTTALDAVAQEWAQHLAAVHDLVHRSDLQVRVLGACLTCTGWAENIAYALSVDAIWSGDGAGTGGWLNSAPHLENIRNGRAGEFGFGVAQSSDGYLWAVQEFGRYPA